MAWQIKGSRGRYFNLLTSEAVERIFSGGRDTIGLRRASLKAETIQTLMFVEARLRLGREVVYQGNLVN
jgi:hypothetical protein